MYFGDSRPEDEAVDGVMAAIYQQLDDHVSEDDTPYDIGTGLEQLRERMRRGGKQPRLGTGAARSSLRPELSMMPIGPVAQRVRASEMLDDDNYVALEVMYRELSPGLVRYLRRMLQHSCLAEDVAHEAFLILVRKWPEVRDHPSPRAWLYKVARHLAFDMLRETSREFLLVEPLDQVGTRRDDPADSYNTKLAVREAIGKLPPRQREAVWLFYFERFKQNEIAAIMHIQRDTVGALLFQARSRLAELAA